MKESQRRVSGKEIPGSGHQLKLVVALILAVSAAGFIAFEPGNLWHGDLIGKLSRPDCNQNHYSDADGPPVCTSVVASTDILRGSDSSAIDADTMDSTNSLQGEASNSPQSRHANKPRDWNNNQSNAYGPRPGYTMAELCSTGANEKRSRCRSGSYDETFNTSETGDAAGSVSRYTISGHVLTTDGLGLNGVTIIASPERLKAQRIPDAETLRFWTVTDSLGAYSLDGLPDGEYTIRTGTQGPYRSARISARAGVNYADLVVYRNSSTVAEGQVLTALGEPLEGVTVLPNLLGQPSVLTDDDGRFRLAVTLKPTVNSFTLRFQRPGYREESGKVQLQHSGCAERCCGERRDASGRILDRTERNGVQRLG